MKQLKSFFVNAFLICFVLTTFFAKAQTPSFTNVAATKGVNIGGAKDGGFTFFDMDNDGDLDLLINTNNDNNAGRSRLLRNNGAPTFSYTDISSTHAKGLFASGLSGGNVMERSAVAGDLNGDGYLDFVRNSSGRLEVYLNKGPNGSPAYSFGVGTNQTPNFVLWTDNVGSNNPANGIPGGMNTEGIGLFDFDNDGDLDIFIENHNWGIDIYRNNIPQNGSYVNVAIPNGATGFQHATPNSNGLGLPQSAVDGDYGSVTDFNDDGYIDAIARKRNENDFFRNNGNGTFSPVTSGTFFFDQQACNGNKGAVSMYDLDNDGDYDLIWTDNDRTQIWLQSGVGSGNFVATNEPWASSGVTRVDFTDCNGYTLGYDGIAVGDIDNDGDLDIFFGGSTGSGSAPSYLFLNLSAQGQPMKFVQAPTNYGINPAANTEGCVFVDYDNDGDLDLYINIDGGANQLWENNLNSTSKKCDYLMVEVLENKNLTVPDRPATGANIVLKGDCGNTVLSGLREVNGGNGHGTQDPQIVHFGLPNGANFEYIVEVHYPYLNGTRVIARDFVNPSTLGGGSGCPQRQIFTVRPQDDLDILQPQVVSIDGRNKICDDQPTNLTLQTAAPAASYIWSTGATTATITISEIGSYQVTVTYANGCTAVSLPFVVTTAPEPVVNVNTTNTTCAPLCDGSATAVVTSGPAPYTYLWNTGANTTSINGLCASGYTVTVTDANGCTAAAGNAVNNNPGPQISITTTNVFCAGDNSGTATVNHLSGGVGPYTYSWSNGQTTQTATGLTVDTYTVTVTDSRGCTTTGSAIIQEFSNLALQVGTTQSTGGADGAANAQAFGGFPPYSYAWSTGAGNTPNISGLAPGAYSVTVTDSDGNFVVETFTITTQNTITAGAFIINMGVSPQTIANGLKPYGLVYDLVRNFNVPVKWAIKPNKTTKDEIDFTIGSTQFRSGAFIVEAEYRTAAVNAVIASWQSQGVQGITTTTNLVLPIYGAITTFSNLVIDQQNEKLVTPYFANAGIPQSIYKVGLPSNLGPCDDTYVMPHADPTWANHSNLKTFNTVNRGFIWGGCHAPSVLEGIFQPGNTSNRMNFLTTTGLQCYNNNGCGSLITQSHAGNAATPYTYIAAFHSDPIMQFLGDLTPSTENGSERWYIPLTTGSWRNTTRRTIITSNGTSPREGVKLVYGPGFGDSNNGLVQYLGGHTAHDRGPITSQVAAQRSFFNFILLAGIEKQLNINANIPKTFVAGTGQTVSVSVTGGTAPYTYAWTTSCGGTFGSTSSASTTLTFPSLPPQTKCFVTVVVTDACGRRNFVSVPISSLTPPPPPYTITLNGKTDVTCFGVCNGTINITVSGATPPYTYAWSDGSTLEDRTNLCQGSYSVTVKDKNNCTKSATYTIAQPALLVGNVTVNQNVSCRNGNDGSITASATGGTPNYTYNWGGGVTTAARTGLTAGTYTVTITDSKGCSTTASATVTQPAAALAGNVTVNNQVSCFGGSDGSITASATGGTPNYTYNWGGGVTTASRTGLTAGTYTVTITDSKGCSTTATSATVTQPAAALAGNVTVNNQVSCFGGSDGSITASATGGTPNYTYNWGGGVTTASRTGLTAGTYTVTITDSKGCSTTASATVTQPAAALAGNVTVNNQVSCFGGSDGSITASATGGTPNYTYNWGGGVTTASRTGLTAGTYTVTITDSKGCSTTASATVTQPTLLVGQVIDVTTVSCNGGNNGAITISVNGGTPGYTFSWSNGANTQNISGLVSGTYSVTIRDSKLCETVLSNINVSEPNSLAANVSNITNVKCNSESNGAINISVSGGATPYTFSWSDGNTSQNRTGLAAGNYNVTVKDANLCEVTINAISVTQPNVLVASLGSKQDEQCSNGDNGAVTVSVTGGTTPYIYQWSNGETTQGITGLDQGTYSVTVRDANNCSTTFSQLIITNPCPPIATNDTAGPINGFDGGINVVNVFPNDSLNGSPVNPNDVNLTSVTPDPTGSITLNPDGSIDVAPNTPTGVYTLTYQICEKAFPTSCDQAIVTIIVEAAPIIATNDTAGPINGFDGANNVLNVFVNDSLNGQPINPSEVNLTVVTPEPTGKVTLNLDGSVDVAAGTPAGTYNLTYQICEKLNPLTNCDQAIVTITVEAAQIVATNDTAGPINGLDGATNVINVFPNDSLNGQPVHPSDVTLTEVTPDPTGSITLNPDGSVDVAPNTPAGTYQLTYQICEKLNPTNCDDAVVTVTVEAAEIVANNDNAGPINGLDGATNVVNVFTNDLLNGNPVNPNDVNLTEVTPDPTGSLTLNPDGSVDVAPNTPAGTYQLTYQICEKLNPTNCDDAVVTVTVEAAEIVANDDNAGPIDGTTGGLNVVNVFTNDELNGQPVNPSDVTLTEVTPDPTRTLTLNPDGSVDVAPNTPAGTYQLTYQICENLNPTNCDDAIVTVTVFDRTISTTATPICEDDAAKLTYTVTPDNFQSTGPVTIYWFDMNGNLIDTYTNLPLTGTVLWPGMVLDANGQGIDWPGWIFQNGQWIQAADGFEGLRPQATVVFSLNPTDTVVVNYPPSSPFCFTDPVFDIIATNDTAGPINGTTGATGVLNVFDNDSLNGALVNPTNVTLTEITPDPTGSLTLNPDDGSVDVAPNTPAGTYTLTYEICEIAAVGTNCDQGIVYVYVITCPSDITENNDLGECGAQITAGVPAVGDGAGIASITNTFNGTANASGFYPIGITPVTYTINTINGGSTTCAINITVIDNENPTITCPSNIEVNNDQGQCSAVVNYDVPFDDNCPDAIMQQTAGLVSGSSFPVGTTTNTFIVTDAAGNIATCSFTVTVIDNENPTIVCPENISQTADAGRCDAQVSVPQPETGDNCGTLNITNNFTGTADASGLYPVGVTTVTYIITDIHNNSTTCSFTVTVTDDENPTIICPLNITKTADAGRCDAQVNVPQPEVDDNCGIQIITNSYTGTADASGIYPVGSTTVTYTISDIHNNSTTCSFTVTVTDDENPTIICPLNITQTADAGRCDAEVNVPLPEVDDNCGIQSITNSYTGTNNASGIYPVGVTTVTYTVTDIHGNSASCSFTITITDDELPVFVDCPSNISIIADSNDCSPIVTWRVPQSGDNCSGATVTSTRNSGDRFPVGTTTVVYTITDASGNEAECTFDVTVTARPLVAALTAPTFNCGFNVSCNGANDGSISVAVRGGCLPYNYLWNTQQTTSSINNLSAGTYTVTITDANGTSVVESITLTQPDLLTVNGVPAVFQGGFNISCNGANDGSINLQPNGGCEPYTFAWSNNSQSQNQSNLSAGTYTVTITDANGCIATQSFTLTEPQTLRLTRVINPIICAGDANGSVNISVSGGTAPYTYYWSNGATTEDAVNLSVGQYNVLVSDANGCTLQDVFTINAIANISINAGIVNAYCGEDNGSINLSVNGGVQPYTYNWANGANASLNTALAAGSYAVTVTDGNGCTASSVFDVDNVSTLEATIANVVADTCGSSGGSVSVNVSGGIAPYTFLWSNGATSQNLQNVSSGSYALTVTDTQGCSDVLLVSVNSGSDLRITSALTNPTCGGNNGAVSAAVTGGTAPYNFLWSNGNNNATASGLIAGFYQLTVTDANGCSATAGVSLSNSASLNAEGKVTNASCGNNSGAIALTLQGGLPPIGFNWSNGATTQNIIGLPAGSYSVQVSDANNCITVASFNVNNTPQLVVHADKQDISCNDANDGAISLSARSAAPYSYSWSNGATTENLDELSPDVYSVTVTDANGCSVSLSTEITQPQTLALSAAITNVLCAGGNDGAIDLTIAGGTLPYTIYWSNGATTEDVSGLVAGFYQVFVTDANGCSTQASFTVATQSNLTVSTGATNATCGENNGEATVAVAGGIAPYTYAWSNGRNTSTISGLSAGVYNVTVTDAAGCTISTAVLVNNISQLSLSAAVQNVNCGGGATGAINLTVTGGTAPYSYVWSNGALVEDINFLAAGTYTVTVSDGTNCSSILNVTVSEVAAMVTTAQSSAATCAQANGGASVSAFNGTAPYSFLWSNGATTASINNVVAGNYVVTITDANNCTVAANISIANLSGPSVSLVAQVATCGNNNGSVSATVSGGTAPYNFLWSNGATTTTINNLAPALYGVTVTDATGCIAVATVEVDATQGIVVVADKENVGCNGNADGSIDVTVTGGTGVYNYTWSNGATTQDLNYLVPGVYTISVADANGCSVSTNVVIVQPQTLALNATAQPVLCAGGNDGEVNLTVAGGTTPFVFNWSNGATTEDLNGVIEGLYSVTVTDANGCSATIAVTVATRYDLVVSSAVTNATCGLNNGSANITVSGGSGSYSFLWSNGASTASINNLSAGTYTVTVEDAAGCSVVSNVIVNNITNMVLRETVVNASCGSPASGVISVQVSGGASPYTYAWNNGATTNSISNLVAGTYCVTVTDTNGCIEISCYTISSSGNIALAVTSNSATCGANNGSATASASLGQAPYTYAWSNGQTGVTANNLNAGIYFVTATDAFGCSAVQSVAVSEADAPAITILATNNACSNGNTGGIDITLQGGVGPFTFNWSNRATTQNIAGLNNGTYAVVVTDDNGCVATASATVLSPSALVVEADNSSVLCNGGNTGTIDVTVNEGTTPYTYSWSNGATTQNVSGLIAGSYAVSVFDANGCSVSTSVNIVEPDALVVSIVSVDNAVCYGATDGNIFIDVEGGVLPYTYNWSNGATTKDLQNIGSGTYTLTVTDANGCSATGATVTIEQPEAVVVTVAEVGDVSCNGGNDGSVSVNVSGGNVPYTYVWSNGATTAELTGVSVGSYNVTVTDVNGCTGTLTVNATVGQPDAINISVTNVIGVPCFGSASGSINITVAGGTAPYTYNWSNGATSEDISGLAEGLYIVTVTDAKGCTSTSSIRVDQLPLIDLSETVATNPTCDFYRDGSISLVIRGGSAPYTYVWSTGATTVEIDNLPTGTYSVTVTDANGCTATAQFSIEGPFCNDPPVAVTDNITTTGEVIIPVLNNDYDPNGDDIFVTDITQNPSNGTVVINVDGTITYTPDEGFVGIDSFTYQICDDGVPALCDTAVVYVTVLPQRPNIFIPNGFSPDGDAFNENWEIVDITQFPKNEVIIFNRWGNKVYEAKPYLNEWNGVNQKGEDLPDGTYYYVLKLNDDNNTTYTGFVVVNRNKQ